ncbi:unnamed protein product [Trifolium pratense]|uniref:Uncharacterized protein n=1 Tax=Trifolium pratense TaxID=57577 RepID=A0ACB0IQW1_TRIPR|nr:unnamed protein product [Trifolium pratense]
MRGQASAELLFDAEIEKTARANRKEARLRKLKEKEENSEVNFDTDEQVHEEVNEMADDNPPPPPVERLLGDYGARDRNRNRLTITNQPVTVNKFEINPGSSSAIEITTYLASMPTNARTLSSHTLHPCQPMPMCHLNNFKHL